MKLMRMLNKQQKNIGGTKNNKKFYIAINHAGIVILAWFICLKYYEFVFPDRLVAGLKILALPTVVRIHLRENNKRVSISLTLFYFWWKGWEPPRTEVLLVRARSEQSAKDFSLKETKFLKRKSADTFNASDSRQSISGRIIKG